jgi:hypothetical protein
MWEFASIFFLIPMAIGAIANYGYYENYIPSYTYPFTLNAGDIISKNLSWTGTQDLDIYLYKQGQDLLNRNIRVTR